MIDVRQIRAARALLDWSQADLAEAVRLATSTIKAIENGRATPRRETLALIAAAFEANGIELTPGSGVRLKSSIVTVHHGCGATPALLDSIYANAHLGPARNVRILGLDERFAMEADGAEVIAGHVARLKAAGIKERILVREGDTHFVNDPDCYRWYPHDYFSRSSPVYIYGDKVAFHCGSLKRSTVIIESAAIATHLGRLFDLVWDRNSAPPSLPGGGGRR